MKIIKISISLLVLAYSASITTSQYVPSSGGCGLSIPQNGYLKPESGIVNIGRSIFVYCDEGYMLVTSGPGNSNKLRCTRNGLVPKGPLPYCKKIDIPQTKCPKCKPGVCNGKICSRFPSATCVTQECSCKPLFVGKYVYYTEEQCNLKPGEPEACAGCLPDFIPCGPKDTCPDVEGATCKSLHCACSSKFFKNNMVVPKNKCRQCRPDVVCKNYPDAACTTQKNSDEPVFVKGDTYYTMEDCNADMDYIMCAGCGKIPCGSDNTCPGVQGATCVTRFCLCDTLFVKNNQVISPEKCQEKPPKSCPKCMGAPCKGRSCPLYPSATCVTQDCSCKPLFVDKDVYYTQEQCNRDPRTPEACAGCVGVEQCGPKDTCPAVVGAKCKRHHCGCESVFVKDNSVIPKDKCACPKCKPGVCSGKICSRFPSATCVTQECSCEPLFVGKYVYYTEEQCNLKPGEPEICAGCSPDFIPCGPKDTCPDVEGASCKSLHCACSSKFFKNNMVVPKNKCRQCRPGVVCKLYPDAVCTAQKNADEPVFVKGDTYYTQEQCNRDPRTPEACAGCVGVEQCGPKDSCPAVVGAKCKRHQCGCESIFVKDNSVIPKDKCACRNCVFSCAFEKCPLYPNAKCVPEIPCGCGVSHFKLNNMKISQEECNGCPANGDHCFIDPCEFATCEAYPNAQCKPNFCGGGCNYDFFVDGKKVKCGLEKCPYVRKSLPCENECLNDLDCPLEQRCCGNGCNRKCMDGIPPPSKCPPWEPRPVCKTHPCERFCLGKPKAQCQENTCGGCFADFYENGVLIPHEQCEFPPCRRLCPADSCADYMCRGVPGRKCVPDTCKGCAPRFYDDKGMRISSYRCSLCPDGNPPSVRCAADPCAGKTCAVNRNAKCMADYCKGCNAYNFYDENGKLIPKQKCEPLMPLCQYITDPFSFGVCGPPECLKVSDCLPWQTCCSNGCSNVCVDV